MAVQFKLDAFQGPLDLLLHLISKHKLNICDIEISLLLDQYLEYMNQLDEQDYESAGEFLEMAARLIYIKTVSLLPQQEEAEELKKDLEGQIIEYSICKKAAESLKELYVGGSVFVREPVAVIINKTYTRVHEPEVLYNAYMGISAKSRNSKPLRAEMFSPIVSKKIVSVTSKIIFVLKKLYKTGVYDMAGLYDGVTGKSERVATFLAVLELTKSGRIVINDDNTQIKFIRKHKDKAVHEEIPTVEDEEQPDMSEIDVQAEVEPEQDDTELENASVNVSDDTYDNVDMSDKKPEVRVSTERVYSERVISCPVQIVEITDSTEQTFTDDEAELADVKTETAENAESEPCVQEQITELTEPPKTVFKPNYWNMRRYFWGKCSVGDDGRNNYWHYG